MKYPAYPKYKDSGVAWLGEVPEHWEVKKVRDVLLLVNGYPFDSELFGTDYGIPLVRIRDIAENISAVFWTGNPVANASVNNGDILIGMDGDFNVAWWGGGYAMLNQRVCCLRSRYKRIIERFSYYCLSKPLKMINDVTYSTTVKHLSSLDINKIRLPIPPLPEQRAIAAFLDAQTSKLDTLISKKRDLIDKLKEKRAALITRTVTRGLPSDAAKVAGLDPHPKMKDSGVEWLGEVPEHWEMPPLYKRYYVELGKMLDEAKITGKYLVPYLRNTDVQWDRLNIDDLPEMDIPPREYRRYTLVKGDLLVCEGGEVGRCAIFQETGKIIGFQKAIHRLRPIGENECPRYLFYVICSAAKIGVFFAEGNPNTIIHLTGEKLRRYRFPCPPVFEQRAIVTYLDRETAAIDTLVAKVETAIERLQEYRAALITAAVTGQIDVREAVQ